MTLTPLLSGSTSRTVTRGIPYAGYYAAVSALDNCVDRLGIRDDTVVVYYSDHGDMFSYRGADHKFICHKDSIRIPFVAIWSGTIPEDLSVDEFVGLQDLMPTILEWARLEAPDHLHGRSLAPLLTGQPVEGWRTNHYTENITHAPSIEQRCIRTSKWKLILTRPVHVMRHYTGDHELYDLIENPEEELNLCQTPRDDEHNRFQHEPPYTNVIADLSSQLRFTALDIDDSLGVELTDQCPLKMRRR